MKIKRLTLTVGITTCYGEDQILDTVKSLRASRGVDNFEFFIVADRVPIKQGIKKELKKYQVKLIENKEEGSQLKKRKQILALCKSDIIVFTQDDVLFTNDALVNIVEHFKANPKVTFISILNKPVKPTNLFENIICVGTNIVNYVAKYWNGGDNYLSVIGRCEAFRTNFIKNKFLIPDEVVSTDAYFYFENKRHNGKYQYLPQVSLYFKNPQNLKEHLRKSTRFQYQKQEMNKYFGDLSSYYQVPKNIIIRALTLEFIKHPLNFCLYICLFIYTRFIKLDQKVALNTIWDVDLTTKKVGKLI